MVKASKILVAGLVQSNFIKQLYSAVQNIKPDRYLVDVINLTEISGQDEYSADNLFNRYIKSSDYFTFWSIRHLFTLRYLKLMISFLKKGIMSAKSLLSFSKRYMIYGNLYNDIKNEAYDTYHFHFPKAAYLDLFWHLKKSDYCVISFWGSDLLRTSDYASFVVQNLAVERANVITTHSIEMREIILSKFGRQHSHKIKFTRFPPHDELYRLILKEYPNRLNYRDPLARKLNFDSSKMWVVVGHNGSPDNNHIQIIESLSVLPELLKCKIFLILPFSYGFSTEEYCEEIKIALKNSGISGNLYKEFLSWDDLARLKCLTDVMVHLPISDALSGTMTEALFAGASIITGSWLPYSPLKKKPIKMDLIDDFHELPDALINVMNRRKLSIDQLELTQKFIEENFFAYPCGKTWIKVLEHAG